MVPDFSGVRKRSNAIADGRASEANTRAASDQIKSFFVPHFSPKGQHAKPIFADSSGKNAKRDARFPDHRSVVPHESAIQTDQDSLSAPAICTQCDKVTGFYELWTTLPSWAPIIKKADGWITIVNPSGKKVPLVLGTVESHYRRDIILGKRFGKLTNYLMIDVDTSSPFHPRNGGIEKILAAMEALGLCRYLLVRSSISEGIHIYFPLAEPVSTWAIACAAHAALTAAGVTIAGGICELFPNKKAFNAEHNGHRLPLQNGSFILDDDFNCISNSKTVFLRQWQLCAAGQGTKQLAEGLVEKHKPIPKPVSVGALPPIAWTSQGESNDVMRQLVNYGDAVMGHRTIQALGDWIVAVAPRLPGFLQFASAESRDDVTQRNWAYRWAKSHFKAGRLYAAKSSSNHNATVAAEALERLLVALDRIVIGDAFGIKKLWHSLSDISRELFGVGFSWKLFQKHRVLILEKINSSRRLGPSRNNEEGKSFLSEEAAEPGNAEAEKGTKKHLPELLTARCVTSIQTAALKASTPPIEQLTLEGSDLAELAMGTAVIFQQPGSTGEGVKTRVTGKTMQLDGTLLYRLEEGAEGQPLRVARECLTVVPDESLVQGDVVRATVAQLVQVLGKACPFVGPGLWTVKRDEVTAKAWGQLCSLVGEV